MTFAATNAPLPLIEILTYERTCHIGILSVELAAKPVALPLTGVNISARVADRIAQVTMTETFKNPHQEHLEAVYTFPLPGGAAVIAFELTVGNRTIKGKVEERGEARRQYQQALEQGKRTALLEQERDDVFSVQVGNLPPGEEVTVKLTYSARLPFFEEGTTEMRLPLVVAPRYIPGTPTGRETVGGGVEEDTDLVPDASRITPPRLAPGFDPQVGCSIEVELIRPKTLGNGGDIVDLCCSQHALRTKTESGSIKVSLSRNDERLNRDFVLRWRLAAETVSPSFLWFRDREGKAFGMVSLVPPKRDVFLGTPRDVVFVVDRSGSMEGVKMTSAARACSLLLATLGPRDRFGIQAFDDQTEWLVPNSENKVERFQPADEAGIERGEKYLRQITSRGGTELDRALSDAIVTIGARREKTGRVPVIVLLTDGQIGDESRVLKRIQQELGEARVFTVGIDTAVNEGFLRRLAALGGGTATFVEPGTQLENALRSVGQEIGHPLVVDVLVEDVDCGLDSTSLAPARIPDLFAGRASTAFFQMKKAGSLRVKGRFPDGKPFEETIEGQEIDLPALAQLWAKTRIVELEDRFRVETQSRDILKKQIVELAVKHSLLTRFTAFVVVDEAEVVNQDGSRRKIVQPVEMPAQWETGAMGVMQSGVMQSLKLQMARSQFSTLTGSAPMQPMPCSAPMPEAQAPPSAKAAAPPSRMEPPVDAPGNIFSEIGDALKHTAGKLTEAFLGGEPRQTVLRPLPPKKPGNDSVEKAFAAFVQAISNVKAELEAGRIPSAAELERTRVELLQELAPSDLGTKLPELQRFLRAAVVEIIAALQTPAISTTTLMPLFELHWKAFQSVKAEVAPYLSGSSPISPRKDPQDPFWESSI